MEQIQHIAGNVYNIIVQEYRQAGPVRPRAPTCLDFSQNHWLCLDKRIMLLDNNRQLLNCAVIERANM